MRYAATLLRDRNRLAWLLVMISLVLHVAEEASTGFLPFYNGLVMSLRERWTFFPLPTFSYSQWLAGLIAGLAVGFILTAFLHRAGSVARLFIGVFAVLMIGNALAHLYGSVVIARILPGFWSSFLLLPAALYLLWRVARGQWPGATASGSPALR